VIITRCWDKEGLRISKGLLLIKTATVKITTYHIFANCQKLDLKYSLLKVMPIFNSLVKKQFFATTKKTNHFIEKCEMTRQVINWSFTIITNHVNPRKVYFK
jgi:hypothetical protein